MSLATTLQTLIDAGHDMYALRPRKLLCDLSANFILIVSPSRSVGNWEFAGIRASDSDVSMTPVLRCRRRGVTILRLSPDAPRRGLSHEVVIATLTHYPLLTTT